MDHSEQHTAPSDIEAITATILTAVERQLTRYFSAMSQQAEQARAAAEHARDELRAEFRAEYGARFPAIETALKENRQLAEAQHEANTSYQQALQSALEERLAEFANHQHWRLNDLEDKVAAQRDVDPETMIQIRQTVRDDMEKAFNGVTARIDDLAAEHQRFDERSSALAQHVNDAMTSLSVRMDDGDQRLSSAVEERLNTFESGLETSLEGFAEQVTQRHDTLMLKLESSESRGVDRLLELETRLKEETGTRLAELEATIGRVGSGFDDAMIALNQRVLGLENSLMEVDERISAMSERLAKVDEGALDSVRAEMSQAVGEAMLVRIELDRLAAETNEKMDKQVVRMSEIEGMLADTMDVSTAVQLERLDELERQMALIDGNAMLAARGSTNDADSTPAAGGNRPAPPSMTLNPRLPGADSTAHDGTLAAEPTFSSH